MARKNRKRLAKRKSGGYFIAKREGIMQTITCTTNAPLEELMRLRLEMLREVNAMTEKDEFDPLLISESRGYFLNGDQITVLAREGTRSIGCASLSFIRVMPTFSHPTGKRAHLMNVYTVPEFRRKGIAKQMTEFLIAKAKERGITEISVDSTEAGHPQYTKQSFHPNAESILLWL